MLSYSVSKTNMLKSEEKLTEAQKEISTHGLSVGHIVSKRHPKMKPFLSGVKGGVDIINPAKTESSLEKALDFIKDVAAAGKLILVVGTKMQAKEFVEDIGITCNIPYINERWLGGTISNFDIIKKRVSHLKSLEKQKADGSLEKYTKKERVKIDKEMVKLNAKFGGMKNLDRTPDVIIVLDMKADKLAIKEANEKGIKVVAIADSNVDPTKADWPIYASDDSVASIKYIANKIKDVIFRYKPAASAVSK